ncbi:MAG TPA: chemotaxis protein CheW [Rhodocyclaceae bacterium]
MELESPTGDPLVPDAMDFLAGFDLPSEPPAGLPLAGPADDGLLPPSQALSGERAAAADLHPLPGQREAGHAGQGVLVGGLRLFLRFDQASEVSEMLPLYRLPGTPPWMRGIANLHGNLVPVIDLAGFFGLSAGTADKPMLLVIGHGEDAVAAIVDGIPERLKFADGDRVPAPLVGDRLQRYVPGAFLRGNDIWLEFEHEQLLEALTTSLSSPRRRL